MTIGDLAGLGVAALAGTVVGAAYFAALWRTVRDLPAARHPARRLLASFVVRFGAVAGVFALLAVAGGWRSVTAGLAGFLIARAVVTRRLVPTAGADPREAL